MDDLTLQTVANYADIIGAGSILGGLLFGAMQLRHWRAQQRDNIATNITQTFYSRDLAQALALLQPLQDGITLKEMRELGPEYTVAAITVTTTFETMGLLVHKRVATLDLVTDLCGGIINTLWRKLAQWQQDMRTEQQQPSWGEWFEWLSIQISKRKQNSEPAHIRYRDWKAKG
jgi:hypothetical protein